eukprot:gnl/Spiro4/28193_TR13946_c0_g1_i1.p2 gnl/Spiro4/28193_TR13946_c0_g1~~gnl/Spiro4/28193_TR13946_c0_g1_i1.p2  ORF type:complete len:122 (-),score=35.96 gnl/Spiro4/28193_TR13946_c0_g1_i1:86-451(-)
MNPALRCSFRPPLSFFRVVISYVGRRDLREVSVLHDVLLSFVSQFLGETGAATPLRIHAWDADAKSAVLSVPTREAPMLRAALTMATSLDGVPFAVEVTAASNHLLSLATPRSCESLLPQV